MSTRLLVTGAGFSGRAIARGLVGRVDWIAGTTRSPEGFDRLRDAGMSPLLFDGITIPDSLRDAMAETTHLLQSIAPDRDGDPVLLAMDGAIGAFFPRLEWIGYLSTVGVYGDHGGAWVDEETPCRPVSARSVMRRDAEEAWLSAGQAAGVPVAILRLSGIYGPGRNALLNLKRGKARRLIKPGQVFNRIHVEDIAGATAHLMAERASGLFNVTDDEPAPPQDPVAFAAALTGVEPPPEQDFASADLTPMARSFYGENKRVANRKLKASGYAMRFPDYREGLAALWRDGGWRG